MKKEEVNVFKRLLLLFAVFSAGLFFENSLVNADENIDLNETSGEYVETYPLFLDDGDVLNFFSKEDREIYSSYLQKGKSDDQFSVGSRSGNKTREKFISKKTFYSKFAGYNPLTPSWSYANSYTISKGRSLSFSTGYTYDGTSATLSVTNSYGVAVSLPANSKKSSKLALKADVTVSKYQVELYNGNTVLKRFNTLRTTSVKNKTNYVHYR